MAKRYLAVIPILFTAALLAYKTNSSLRALRLAWTSNTIASRPGVVAWGAQVSATGVFERTLNYFLAIWPALAFGILIAAAVRAFVPEDWLRRVFKEKSLNAQLAAGFAGTPLMLCSCCVTPIFTSVAEATERVAPALSLMIASPALNPAAIALTFIFFDLHIGVMRLLLSLTAVLTIGPLVETLFPDTIMKSSVENPGNTGNAAGAPIAFVRSLLAIVLQTVPALIAGVVVSMVIVQSLPANVFSIGSARFAAIFFTAAFAVPLALPTFLEIPLALSLLAIGFPSGAAFALLFAGPAINLPSLMNLSRLAGWKTAAAVAAMIWFLAVAGGLWIGG